MKICFNGLGPNSRITYNNKIYIDGSEVEMDEDSANMFIKKGIAFELKNKDDFKEMEILRKNEIKNKNRRINIIEKKKNSETERGI